MCRSACQASLNLYSAEKFHSMTAKKKAPSTKSAKAATPKSKVAKPAAKKPAAKKKSGKMPPELLERFKKKSAAKKDGNTAGMKKKGGLPAGRAGAKAEARGMKAGADKKKGAPRGSGMKGMKR